ncbi:hypothetical protein M0R45_009371 [Rubus argutus]|uniref:Uncharacterized protein n=1 Tax=Rubus argutus TaxID=59490 RepID=A0AAW1Y4A4_RUBAR
MIEVSSSSAPKVEDLVEENKRCLGEVQEVIDLVMARSREGHGQASIDEYLKQPDEHERGEEGGRVGEPDGEIDIEGKGSDRACVEGLAGKRFEPPKVLRKKMDSLPNADDDYVILDELLSVCSVAQTLAMDPLSMVVKKTDKVVNFKMSAKAYDLGEKIEEEIPLN